MARDSRVTIARAKKIDGIGAPIFCTQHIRSHPIDSQMGTRGRYGFRYKGLYILFYNHHDSYCDSLGNQILNELKAFTEADFQALKALLKEHLQKSTIKEGNARWDGDEFQGILEAAKNPEEYGLNYVGRAPPPENIWIEYTYIVDLDKEFLRVVTLYDKFKFTFKELPHDISEYDEGPDDCEYESEDELVASKTS